MDKFTGKVLNYIRKNDMVVERATVIVGFSGGADSTALLNVLNDLKGLLKIKLMAVHVNHCIRKEAKDDEAFAIDFCGSRGIAVKSFLIDVPKMAKERGLTEEEAGRLARYKAFEEVAGQVKESRIAVAHHQNDVAETLIMNLSRGSGVRGAGAIRPVRGNIIRPLLCVSRTEIEEYLRKRDISFCTDATNLENDHTRNVVRNLILPELERDVNKRAVANLSRAAASFERADAFIRQLSGEVYDNIVVKTDEGLSIKTEDILREPEVVRENLILRCFEELVPARKDISFAHVDAVLSLIQSTDGEAFADLPQNLVAIRSYENLFIGKRERSKHISEVIAPKIVPGEETEIRIEHLGTVKLTVLQYDGKKEVPEDTYTKWFDYDRIQEVVLRVRRAGDFITIEQNGALVRKKLSKFMTDSKIPNSRRDEMYLLADGSEILWIPGYRISAAYKISENTRNILTVKIKR
ncbi:MAG: tRNA lysidine(34) synthetase TilS [Butyrivibrio sp.]|nr:tRNA lysidine(34) synthetase TilS [Butyrivibrio sp.]